MFASFSDSISNHLLLFGPLICGICGGLIAYVINKKSSLEKPTPSDIEKVNAAQTDHPTGPMTECPHCQSRISTAAGKCPYCREWVKVWSKNGWARRNSGYWVFFLIVIAGPQIYSRYLFSGLQENTEILLRKPVAKILSSKKVGENGALAVIGVIRNEGLQSTGGISVEVTFYGKTNELVDTSITYLSGNFSHGEVRAFKVSFGCEGHPIHGDYDHYVATVR